MREHFIHALIPEHAGHLSSLINGERSAHIVSVSCQLLSFLVFLGGGKLAQKKVTGPICQARKVNVHALPSQLSYS